MPSFFDTMNISASGLTAQRLRMDLISENIANAETTRTAEGGPYKRKIPVFREILNGKGIEAVGIEIDRSQGPTIYEPAHPDANAEGYVERPNVNIVEEMVNMISSSRSYEANITSMGITKSMISRTLDISRT
jgi:flagellar basal-body rod protein FlgC